MPGMAREVILVRPALLSVLHPRTGDVAHLSGPRPGSGPNGGANVSSNKRCERSSTGSVTVS